MGAIPAKIATLSAIVLAASVSGLGSDLMTPMKAGTGVGEAAAQSRQGAPIVYAGPSGTRSSAAQTTAEASAATAPPARQIAVTKSAGERIAFIYPSAPYSAVTAAVQATPAPTPAPTLDQPQRATTTATTSNADTTANAVQPVAGPVFDEEGMASWYGETFHGRPTANGEIFDMHALTAAHPNLPLPSLVQVTNLSNQKEVVVRVNDRGPFIEGRILDLSRAAAEMLDFIDDGETRVRIRYLGPAPLGGAAPEPSAAPIPSSLPEAAPAAEAGPGAAVLTPIAEPLPAPKTSHFVAATPAARPPRMPSAMPAPQRVANSGAAAVFVQIGAFSSISNAERLKTTLAANLPVTVLPVRVNGADFFRVLVGPWPDERAAAAVQSDLAARNFGEGRLVRNP